MTQRWVVFDNEFGPGIMTVTEERQGPRMSSPVLVAMARDIAIVLAVVVYVIDTL